MAGRAFRNVDEVRAAVKQFVDLYNAQWLVAKRDYHSPLEARRKYNQLKRAA